ncbi:MAG: PadR family transcriptional regulator [Solirubrobacterales bacterium]
MELSSTAYVILGLLRKGAKTGYEIKAVVDRSTRFFWAASYGQIYPELRRLAEAGLIEGTSKPSGGRKRTESRLTPSGRKELRRWLEIEPEVFEMRDEGLLKLFFAGAAPRSAATAIEARRAYHVEKLRQLAEIEPLAKAAPDPHPYMVLRYGIALSEFTIRWCDDALAELGEERRSA